MALEFHNRRKNAAAPHGQCHELAQRWGSVERVAGAATRADLRRGRTDGKMIVLGLVVGVLALAAAGLAFMTGSSDGTTSSSSLGESSAAATGAGTQQIQTGKVAAAGGNEGQKQAAAFGAGQGSLSLGDAIKRTEPSVVRLNTFAKSGQPLGFGTGFLVDERGWIATNYHVVRTAARVLALFRDGTTVEVGGLVAEDEGADLAIVALANPPRGLRPLELHFAPPATGESVFAMGHPQGLTFSVTTGSVGALRRTADFPPELPAPGELAPDTLWVQSDAAIAGGSSGGPLCDGQGRVIGVNSWLAVRENFAFSVHVGHLQSLMKAAPDKLARLPGDRPVGELDNPLATIEPRVQLMWQEFLRAEQEFGLQLRRARSPAEQNELLKTGSPRPKYAERFLQIADGERKTTAAVQALFLACQMHLPGFDGSRLERAIDRLTEDHITDRGVYRIFGQLAGNQHLASKVLLTKAIEQSPHRHVQGAACYHLARWLLAEGKPDNTPALRLLERCAKDFADVKLEGGQLGQLAMREGFRARYLSVGSTAQEIEGKDADGKPLKLSELRGKVVLLDFFADWCPHCVAMYPHEQTLVKQYAGRPFALVGVNGDSFDTLRQIIGSGKVSWRCWNDGQNGPIAQQWQIGTVPTLFLLDARGVIRQIFLGRPMPEQQLDEAIEKLVAEAEKAAAGAGSKNKDDNP